MRISAFRALALMAALVFIPVPCLAAQGHVVKVIDGDSLVIKIDGKPVECRMTGIDAPELGQKPWGHRARNYLIEILQKSAWRVTVETDAEERDKYGRSLVYLRDKGGLLINLRMAEDGYAAAFSIGPNVAHAAEIVAATERAKSSGKGIWTRKFGLKETPSRYRERHERRR
ncbi:MAG: thermonuclease family protein [Nitrospirae bacterium]|nr:thermonuclease family protein [Nitrospirota bacterium]